MPNIPLKTNRLRRVHIAWIGCLVATGCAAPKPPPLFTAPPVVWCSDHYLGSPLTGPVVKPLPDSKPTETLGIHVSAVALDRMPPDSGESFASRAKLIAVTSGGVPVRAGPRLTQSARITEGEDESQFEAKHDPKDRSKPQTLRIADFGEIAGALPAGVTTRFDLGEPSDTTMAGRSIRRHLGVEVYRPKNDTAVQLALIVEDFISPPIPLDTTQAKTSDPKADPKGAKSPPPVPPPLSVPVREILLVDRPGFTDKDRFSLLLPFRVGSSGTMAVALFVDLRVGSDDAKHRDLVAHGIYDLANTLTLTRAATRPYREVTDNPEWPGLRSGLDAMAKPQTPRPAMLFLASQTNVPIFESIALSGDDATRGELARKVFAKIGVPAVVKDKEKLAWVLESASFELLSEMKANAKLPAELDAVLAIHAGEAGRHPGSLDEGLKTSTNRRDFALRLIAENYIYLEDSSPASRVRAFDWLGAHDRAPALYDPLGPAKERRVALERAATAAQP